ncbi:hypothetical protein V1512DRAFT_260011 [Lipomyces arxii]|uniref:uncharacterized protein n=1 Tax=Lipomyces arxii TaxID=56418 RepID=UPI0034CDCAE2
MKSSKQHPSSSSTSSQLKKAPRSRNGCWTCRSRKIKCDEVHPKCTPCSRLGITCDYTRRLNYKDDTSRILSKMVDVIDTTGCPVYDEQAIAIFEPYAPHRANEYEDAHDEGFVVLSIHDYADDSNSPDETRSEVSRKRYYSDSEDDDEEDEIAAKAYDYKRRQSQDSWFMGWPSPVTTDHSPAPPTYAILPNITDNRDQMSYAYTFPTAGTVDELHPAYDSAHGWVDLDLTSLSHIPRDPMEVSMADNNNLWFPKTEFQSVSPWVDM